MQFHSINCLIIINAHMFNHPNEVFNRMKIIRWVTTIHMCQDVWLNRIQQTKGYALMRC